jgi:hypothetical protein
MAFVGLFAFWVFSSKYYDVGGWVYVGNPQQPLMALARLVDLLDNC